MSRKTQKLVFANGSTVTFAGGPASDAWTHAYDVTDPDELGDVSPEEAPALLAAYNQVQRVHLFRAFPDGPPVASVGHHDDEAVAEYCDEWFTRWREAAVREVAP